MVKRWSRKKSHRRKIYPEIKGNAKRERRTQHFDRSSSIYVFLSWEGDSYSIRFRKKRVLGITNFVLETTKKNNVM